MIVPKFAVAQKIGTISHLRWVRGRKTTNSGCVLAGIRAVGKTFWNSIAPHGRAQDRKRQIEAKLREDFGTLPLSDSKAEHCKPTISLWVSRVKRQVQSSRLGHFAHTGVPRTQVVSYVLTGISYGQASVQTIEVLGHIRRQIWPLAVCPLIPTHFLSFSASVGMISRT